jgi:hypothetical protein
MLAFDFPPDAPVAVEYLGLSKSSAISETQKDVLRRALSEIISGAGEIVEVDEIRRRKSLSEVYIKCLQCDLKDDLTHFTLSIEEEDRFRMLNNLQRSQFKIHIRRPAAEDTKKLTSQVWTVEIGSRKTVWFPALKLDLLPADGRLQQNNFIVQNCIEGVSCPSTKLYRTPAECEEQIKQLSNRRIDTASSMINLQKSTYLTADKIPFVSDIRSASQVRVTLLSKDSSLSIRASGKALRGGSIGDYIPVEVNSASGSSNRSKLVNAKIISEGEVEVVR